MANPREYTCKLLEMVDNDVEDMMHMNQWNDTSDEESTEENDSEEEDAKGKITIGDTVTVDGVEYIAMQGPERWGCTECAGDHNQLCDKLPVCGIFIFVRKENQ